MRNITEGATTAFWAGKRFSRDNTQVSSDSDGMVRMFLHGSVIAEREVDSDKFSFTLAGWPTPTTRDRLKGLGVPVYQSRHVQYLADEVMDVNKWYEREHAV